MYSALSHQICRFSAFQLLAWIFFLNGHLLIWLGTYFLLNICSLFSKKATCVDCLCIIFHIFLKIAWIVDLSVNYFIYHFKTSLMILHHPCTTNQLVVIKSLKSSEMATTEELWVFMCVCWAFCGLNRINSDLANNSIELNRQETSMGHFWMLAISYESVVDAGSAC